MTLSFVRMHVSCVVAGLLVCAPMSAAAQAPTLAANVDGNRVTLEWTPVAGAVAYDVVVTGALSGSVTVPGNQTRYEITAPPGAYAIQVRGRAGSVVGPFSNTVTIAVGGGGPCSQIQRVSLSASVSGRRVTLQWSAAPGAIGYRVEIGRSPGAAELAHTVSAGTTAITHDLGVPGTFYARVWAGNACSTSTSNEVQFRIEESGPTPGGPRTPDPPPGGILPLPGYGPSVVQAVANAYPGALRNSCVEHGGNNEWLFRLVLALRTFDTRWGLNWKRGHVGDLSQDVVTYNFGPGPDEGTTNVYIIDVIAGHCGGNPGPNWTDQTAATRNAGSIGRWTLQPLRPFLPATPE